MSVHRFDLAFDQRASRIPVAYPDPIGEAAMHGLAGDFVRTVLPHTEADPAALLVQFLAAFGSCVGRGPHYLIEGDEHHGNLFACLVGNTSKARKGTSWGRVRQLYDLIDDPWSRDCVHSGLSSGEGLIHAVRDGTSEEDPGVHDKRLLVVESEFANVLRQNERDGNTLSRVVRDAWDRGRLATMTKHSPTKATGAHISIIGHITQEELRRYLTATEMANGFANRFVFVCVRRSKKLPMGGEIGERDMHRLAQRLAGAVGRARRLGRLTMTPAARDAWEVVYEGLADDAGLAGHVTARAEAQIIRLSTLYAMVDGHDEIDLPHIEAAAALWEYSEASVHHIFGRTTGNLLADRILAALTDRGEMTRTDINGALSRNHSKDRIDAALEQLENAGTIARTARDTGGRPAEVWTLV